MQARSSVSGLRVDIAIALCSPYVPSDAFDELPDLPTGWHPIPDASGATFRAYDSDAGRVVTAESGAPDIEARLVAIVGLGGERVHVYEPTERRYVACWSSYQLSMCGVALAEFMEFLLALDWRPIE